MSAAELPAVLDGAKCKREKHIKFRHDSASAGVKICLANLAKDQNFL